MEKLLAYYFSTMKLHFEKRTSARFNISHLFKIFIA